jgi:hypothetical protein
MRVALGQSLFDLRGTQRKTDSFRVVVSMRS